MATCTAAASLEPGNRLSYAGTGTVLLVSGRQGFLPVVSPSETGRPDCAETGRFPGLFFTSLATRLPTRRRSRPIGRAPPATAARQKRDSMRPKKTILCVDDNEQVLSVRKFLLETRGYRVISVLTPQSALDVIQEAPPGSIDLLLCDLLMPQMDGNELVRRAKHTHPGLPAMIISGTVNAFDRASAADAFLPKGACSPAEMIERIRILVARKRGPKKAMHPVTLVGQVQAIAS